MSTEKASPAVESLGTREKRIANILLRFLNEVKEPMETISFLSRIMEEEPKMLIRSRCPNCHRWFDPTCNEEGHSIEGETVAETLAGWGERDAGLDPVSFYKCDLCNNMVKGREIKVLDSGHKICHLCESAEINFGINGGEK